MAQAIQSNYFRNISAKESKEGEVAIKKGSSEEEVSLYNLSQTQGWGVLDIFIQSLEKELDDSIVKQMEAGSNFDEIGRVSVVKEITKLNLKRIKDKVNDAKEAVEKQQRQGGTKK